MQWVCPKGKLPLSTGMAGGYKKDFFAISTGRCKRIWEFGELNQPSSTCWRDVWYPLDRELKQQWGKKDSQELKVNWWWEVSIPGSGLHFLGSLVSQACVTGPLEKEPSQNVLQHLRKAINPILMGLLLRNAECQKILSKLSRPEDAPHLWKHHIYHVWLRNYLTPKLSVIDLNITKTIANLLCQVIDRFHGNTVLFSQVHLVHSWGDGAFLPVGAGKGG